MLKKYVKTAPNAQNTWKIRVKCSKNSNILHQTRNNVEQDIKTSYQMLKKYEKLAPNTQKFRKIHTKLLNAYKKIRFKCSKDTKNCIKGSKDTKKIAPNVQKHTKNFAPNDQFPLETFYV